MSLKTTSQRKLTGSRFNSTNSVVSITSGSILYLDAGNLSSYPGTGTTWTDLSGYGNNGTLTNGPTFSSANGGSIVFDGTNDRVNFSINSAFNFGTGDFSVFSWINTTKVSNYTTIFALDDASTGNGIILFTTITSGVFRTWVAGAVQNTSTSIADGTWKYVGITRSSGTVYQYINGTSVGNFSAAGSVLSNQHPTIGIYYNGSDYIYQGNIAGAQVYNRSLSASEVLQNYNAVKARYGL
jgi:hypothetical protein